MDRTKYVDPYLKQFPCVIKMSSKRNHPVMCADALRRRDVGEDVKLQLRTLFENGHSPSSAHNALQMDLQISEGPNYAFVAADRAVCPDLNFIYRFKISHQV